MVALTNSGNHAAVVRVGTRSPEGVPRTAMKGGKGLKKPDPPSAILEEAEGMSQAKHEPEGQGASGVDPEIAASRDDLDDDDMDLAVSDTQKVTQGDTQEHEGSVDGTAVVPESGDDAAADGDEDDDDDEPMQQRKRTSRHSGSVRADNKLGVAPEHASRSLRRALRSTVKSRETRGSQRGKKAVDESSDFEPGEEEGGEENVSDSADSDSSPRKASQQVDEDDSSNARPPRRAGKSGVNSGRPSDKEDSEVADELAEELEDLRSNRPRRRAPAITYDDKPQTRKRKPVDYRILRPDLQIPVDDDGPPAASTPSKKGRGGGAAWQRSLFSTYGPFGGAGGPPPVFGGPGGIGAAGGVDSDSSDDDNLPRQRASGVGGMVGMTPTSGAPAGFGLFPPAQTHSNDALQAPSGTPANLGKIKDKQALADADPLGVDQNVNFDSVGGLQGHVDQLKEMVALPLLYPEVFQRFHVTPPRGVLFHGPPGTGKRLFLRCLLPSSPRPEVAKNIEQARLCSRAR